MGTDIRQCRVSSARSAANSSRIPTPAPPLLYIEGVRRPVSFTSWSARPDSTTSRTFLFLGPCPPQEISRSRSCRGHTFAHEAGTLAVRQGGNDRGVWEHRLARLQSHRRSSQLGDKRPVQPAVRQRLSLWSNGTKSE